jgi:methylated-DNA-[protein]-cysteine S-methyltransferase
MKYRSGGDERSHSEAERLAAMIGGYFEGHPVAIPWQLLDTQGWTTAQSAVYGTVARIPYGEVRTYGAVARLAGRPGAARFVGNCMARNPFPVLIPCHRVVAAGGGLGGFGGGLDLKRKMLDLEGRSADHG